MERLEPATGSTVTAEEFVSELMDFAAKDQTLERAKFKIIAIRLNPNASGRVRTRIWYDIVGRTTGGEVWQHNGEWHAVWQLGPGKLWQLLGVQVQPATLVRAPRAYFTDVTRAVLRPGPHFEQLASGLEYWTVNLDAAVGVQQSGLNGIAVADVDNDGWEDFYVAQEAGLPNRFYRNNGDGTFTERAKEAGGLDVLDPTSAVLFFDYDNDGDADLLVLTRGGPLLFANDGQGDFALQDSVSIGLLESDEAFYNPMSVCAADYNRDGWLDLYVTFYEQQYGSEEGTSNHPTPFYDAQNGPPNVLYRNNGDGTFTDVTAETGLDQNNNHFSLACAWGDYNNDGWPDLYVANDFGRNNLYRANGDGTFTDVAAEAGVEDIGAGMSAAWEDYDNDGWLDLYVGNMWSSAGLRTTMQPMFKADADPAARAALRRMAKGNSLFRNRGDGTFEDVTEQAGVSLGRWAWGSNFLDVDRDGNEDIYIVNGFITNESSQDL
ncbi:VCBS repeat-containing protein [Acidobacteriia bacterium AH_259_A11_L15]|nr:VCBS repeat-containing protein [Acidobacteriia bacterium AH_259_A11_L15]